MPKKGGKKGGKKGKKGGKKKGAAGGGVQIEIREPPEDAVRRLMKTYDRLNKDENRRVCTDLKRAMQHAIDHEQLLTRMILHPVTVKIPKKQMTESFVVPEQVNLQIFLKALNDSSYVYFKDLICWDLNLDYLEFTKLCLMLERQKKYRYLRQIELWNCSLSPKSAVRFSECLPTTQLTWLTLDDNEIEDEGAMAICRGLKGNKVMKRLSLNYCGITSKSGQLLGTTISTTNIIELCVDGNDLGCEGFVSMVESLCLQADEDAFYRQAEKERKLAELVAEKEAKVAEERLKAEAVADDNQGGISKSDANKSTTGKKGTKGKKKKGGRKGKRKSKEPAIPENPGPYLAKLHLADNGIDMSSATETCDLFAVASCLSRLMRGSDGFVELDLSYNEVGNSAARIIQEALEFRKEEKLSKLRLSMTCRVDKDIFAAIYKVSGGGAQKRARKGSGKGKKKGKKKK
ncbi:uncharacterized protein LOC142335483 isoform X2 [Convolutriloba macropyga]|uniref:uncharacterized protein LOC142335483 isoform X2 n=1 Tax=Convolutriloba macropyga TaxID=536237 RepID=UPI003F523023